MAAPKTSGRRIALVIAAAFAVRLVFLAWSLSGWHISQLSSVNKSYLAEGYAIAAGYGYVSYFDSEPVRKDLLRLRERVGSEGLRLTPEFARSAELVGAIPATLHPPGMPLLIAGLHRLLGGPVDLPLQILGSILDAITAGLVFWIAGSALGPRVGFAAGLAYAFFPPSAYAAVEKAPTVFLTGLVAASLACLLQGTRSSGRRSLAWFAAVGALLGLGAYFRADYVLLPAFFGLALWVFTRRFARSLASMVLAQLIVFALLFPWAYRNHERTGHWIFTSTAAGAVMIHGLGMFENPWGFGMSDEDRMNESVAQGFTSNFSTPEADAYFRGLFWRSISEHPLGYVVSVVKRLPAAIATPYDFGLANPWKTRTFTEARKAGVDRYEALRSPGYILAAYWDKLAMAGLSAASLACVAFMLFAERRQAGLILLLLSPHLYSLGTHILVTHMQPYYVQPSAFCWLFGVGYVMARGWRKDEAAAPLLQPGRA